MDTTTVRVRVTSPSGEPVQGAYVRAALESVGVDLDGYVDRGEVTATTDAQGLATLDLWPNTGGTTGAEYRIVARGSDGRKLIDESVSVPESAADVWLHDIVMLPAPTAKPYDEASIAVIQQDRILAQSARDAAQQSEANASGSAAQASNSATAAGNSETNATGSAAAAANSATAASTAETNAQQHAADAETAKTGAETARAGAETAQGAAETARDDALSIYGDALTQQQAVTDAQTAAGTATTKATEAGNSATAAAGSASTATTKATEAGTARDQAQAAAVTATDKAGAASLDADAAATAKTAAETANTEAQQAKTDTQALAQQVTVDAAATLDRSADLISHANSTYSDVTQERQLTETASQAASGVVNQALSLYGSAQALTDAVDETYVSRAVIDVAVSHNLLVATRSTREAEASAQVAIAQAQAAMNAAGTSELARDDAEAARSQASYYAGQADQDRVAVEGLKADMEALILNTSQEFDAELLAAGQARTDAQTAAADAAQDRMAAEQAYASTAGLYSSAQDLQDAVTETYINRAMINLQISTNMIVLRA